MIFQVSRRVNFYETDLMGIVHHSNYIRFFEEGRVAWAFEKKMIVADVPDTASQFAVLETWVQHKRPLRFGDLFTVQVQARRQGACIEFQYRLVNQDEQICALAKTRHANLSRELKPRKLSAELIHILEKEVWTETWLLSL